MTGKRKKPFEAWWDKEVSSWALRRIEGVKELAEQAFRAGVKLGYRKAKKRCSCGGS